MIEHTHRTHNSARHLGNVAIVTGAASGIGRATALALAAEGASVVGLDRDSDGLASLVEADKQITTHVADITVEDDIQRVVALTLSEHEKIDVVANVAGIMDGFLAAHEVDDRTWDRVFDVNVTGPMRLVRAVLPTMIEQRSGAIVNVSSEAGIRGGASGVAYTSSKHAIIGFNQSVAWTYAPSNIRSNVICPGSVDTGISVARRGEWAADRQQAVAALSVRRAQPDELASVIAWLASTEASNVNGAVVPIDGAWSAG